MPPRDPLQHDDAGRVHPAGDPQRTDVTQVREAFHESRWAAWNLVSVATTIPAFGLLAWALVLYGRDAG